MGTELTIARELANIGATLTELSSVAGIVNGEIRNGDFSRRFNRMLDQLAMCYDTVIANLQPFCELDSDRSFAAGFDDRYSAYRDCCLKEVSKPRRFSDDAYEEYLVLKTLKQSKTGFPLLKRTFGRLDEFVDKWVTNDAWLAMSIDTLFKMLHRLLNEVDGIRQKDPDDAWQVYEAAFTGFDAHLALIKQKHRLLGNTDKCDKTPAMAF